MKKLKKIAVTLAVVLLVGCVIGGTLAFLTDDTDPVVNTFVAAGGSEDFVKTFALKEYKYTQNTDGTYAKEGDAVTGTDFDGNIVNKYKVLPGTTIPKEAFVELKRTSDAPAYLFIEVVSGLPSDNAAANDQPVFNWSIDSSKWEVTTATGKNGGTVYVYKDVLGKVTETATYTILTDNKIVVNAKATAAEIGTTEVNMEFYAYICQATVANTSGVNTSDPAEVFNICFNQ